MKSQILFTAIVVGSASAFAPASQSRAFVPQTALNAEFSRQAFLTQAATIFGGAVLLGSTPVNAATYGSFGAASTAVLDPKEAEVDDEIMASKTVQSAIVKIKEYKTSVEKIQSILDKDSQANIRPIIIKELDFANLRVSLNTFNSAFEEDTQRGTDRLIRVIIQDITELEIANNQKDGIARSPRRVETMKGKLSKLTKAFDDILAFAK